LPRWAGWGAGPAGAGAAGGPSRLFLVLVLVASLGVAVGLAREGRWNAAIAAALAATYFALRLFAGLGRRER
jgi:hypothetical protein